MKIYSNVTLDEFEAWSGGERTLDRVRSHGLINTLEAVLEDLYSDGIDETHLNDILRFDDDEVYRWVGLRTEYQVRERIDEITTEIEDLQNEIEELMLDLDYDNSEDIEDIQCTISDLNEELYDLKEELEEF